MTLAIFQDVLEDMVRDTDSNISADEFTTALDVARLHYSKDRPRNVVSSVVSDGTNFIDLPAEWIAGFSKVIAVRRLTEGGLAPWCEWEMYTGVGAEQILVSDPADAAETIYITFTFTHTLDAVSTTIPDVDRIAVCHWAAAHLLEQLSSHYAGHKQTMLQADAVDWQSKSRDYASRANKQRQLYSDHMGIKADKVAAAGVVVNLDLKNSLGKDRLTHPNRYR